MMLTFARPAAIPGVRIAQWHSACVCHYSPYCNCHLPQSIALDQHLWLLALKGI
jgi:hypothetical protein